jgi:TatD family-associated radical SAM protein
MSTLSYVIGNSLYLNITDRCTLACTFCPKHNGSHRVHDYDLTLDHRPGIDEILAAIEQPSRFDQVVFCGFGEPTLRLKVLLKVAGDIKRRGGQVRLNTDGLANLVHKRNVLPELSRCVDAMSISMNAQNETLYQRHCKPAIESSFQAMLDFVELAPDYISDVTASAIDGLDGVDLEACRLLATQRGVKFRRRELDNVG